MYRQGDLLFVSINQIPTDAQIVSDGIIVKGAVSGHSHRVKSNSGQLVKAGNDFYIKVGYRCIIGHEEHDFISLPAGMYKIVRQREYEPAGWRQVED